MGRVIGNPAMHCAAHPASGAFTQPDSRTENHVFSETPDKPSQYLTAPTPAFGSVRPSLFKVEVATLAVSSILDGLTTARNSRRGMSEAGFPRGSSYLLGKHPSGGRYAATFGAVDFAQALLAYKLERCHNRVLRMIGHGLMAQGTYAHLSGFSINIHAKRPN
jgi:hypothetical protein